MYDHFEGKISVKTPTYAVINCGGVGYHMNISLHTFSRLPDSGNFKLFAHLAVREDAMVLFGFAEESEREMFRHLVSVSGVGPSTARMILSSMTPDEVSGAVASGDVGTLKAVKGIGEKSAQRIIVDLKGKIGKDGATSSIPLTTDNKMREEALTALVMLGFARNAAEKAVDRSLRSEGNAVSVEHLIKLALKNL